MDIRSPAFAGGSDIPQKYTCEGEDVSPPLTITNQPQEAQSLALIVVDPDSPSGDFVHWMVWNIPPNVTDIQENSIPAEATEGTNDFGRIGWGGPCPGSGKHRYEFQLYALKTSVDLPRGSDKQKMRSALAAATIDRASLIGLYEKSYLK